MIDEADLKAQIRVVTGARSPVTADEVLRRVTAAAGTPRGEVVRPMIPPDGGRSRGSGLTRRTAIGWAAVVIAIALVAVGVAVKTSTGGGTQKPSVAPEHGGSAPASLVQEVTSVPASVYTTVGEPKEIDNQPRRVGGRVSPLDSGGKPEVLYVWASYCPFCAAENWALVMALSKFGTFKDLGLTNSSLSDYAPDTETLSFYGATYSSPYLVFTSYDLATNRPAASASACNVSGYECLQRAPASDYNLLENIGGGSFPFLDFGNKIFQAGSGFESQPLVLQALTRTDIATDLHDANSAVAQAEVGEANYFVAAICDILGNPAISAC